MTDRRTISASLAMLVMGLAGCGSIGQADRSVGNVQHAAESALVGAQLAARPGGVIHTKRPRIAGDEILVKTSPLPSTFTQPVSYVTKGTQSLAQTLDDVAAATGITIRSAEVANMAHGRTGGSGMGALGPEGRQTDPLAGNVAIQYSGTARGLLDELAGKADLSWRYSEADNAVQFFRYETRTMSVNVPAGAKAVSSAISLAGVTGSSGGGGGASSGGGNVSVSHSLTIDPWTSLLEGVRSILADGKPVTGSARTSGGAGGASAGGGGGVSLAEGSAIANPELGLITVTAKPIVLDRVARYIGSINAKFAQNVFIDVKIMSVTLSQQNSAGFSMNLLYNSVGKLGGSLSGPPALQAGSATPGILSLGVNSETSPWNGSALIAQALAQFGKVALVKQGQVLAVNGQPSPLQVANEINYVASSATTVSPNVGSVTSQTPGTKVVGFTANFTPLVLGDNRILLSYQMQLSSLAAPLTPNAQGVVTPQIASQSLPGQAFLKDGQAIVLFGYDEQRDGIDQATHLAGASKAVTRDRQLMVIVVQVRTGGLNERS